MLRTQTASARIPASTNRRAWWLRQLRQWHWISAAVSLLGMLMFAATGITLNHAAQIEAKPAVERKDHVLPGGLLSKLDTPGSGTRMVLPSPVAVWVAQEFGIDVADRAGDWSEDEVYISLPRPGGDAWLSIDRETGDVQYEVTDRGWISYLNDLHKGRNTGSAWSLFIDAFALSCVIFALTGLALLQLYAMNRPMTWPLVGAGCVLPILIAFFLIH
ncbi:PepSY-associated TM helix domain-containing protein [Methyloceanibacter sp.]|uniref:PepSY-associated TM helix domain-containing protein n=1 Tax=Methyloceanibacter sp. TaxID=1965321 RepID=UPI002C102EDF|nr:PepSY-associated TM helix domain-containing protein [Methyloceanibacter sp.]HML90758.1 PepSY-associated TM helix domain-containing protein [Methyloceanibacter sp.]